MSTEPTPTPDDEVDDLDVDPADAAQVTGGFIICGPAEVADPFLPCV